LEETVEKGLIVTKRKVITVGKSKAVTLPKKWLEFQRWLGREITEVAVLGNDLVVIAPSDKVEKAKKVLEALEKVDKKMFEGARNDGA